MVNKTERRKKRKTRKNNTRKRFIGGEYTIADRIVATHILEQYHYGNLLQDVSKLAPLLKRSETPLIVWRGVKNRKDGGAVKFINELETNGSVQLTRLTSTGDNPGTAVNFCGSVDRDIMCTIFKINLHDGFPFIDVNDSIRFTRLHFPGEKEYLLLPEVEGKKLIFDMVKKTVSPDETNPDTLLVHAAILEGEKEAEGMYWYKHPTRQLKQLEKRFVIYEVNARYI